MSANWTVSGADPSVISALNATTGFTGNCAVVVTTVVVCDVVGTAVWVADTVVVAEEVAGAVVWVAATVWVMFAAPAGSATMAAQTRKIKKTTVIVPGDLLIGA